MKTAKKPNFIDWNSAILISSLKKIDLNIVLIVFLDALFYLISGYAIMFWLQRVQEKMEGFYLPADVMSLGQAAAGQLVTDVRKFYYLIIFSLILLLAAIIFLASIFKGIIWAKTTGTKLTPILLSKFFMLNLMWMGFWSIALFLAAYLAEPAAVPLMLLALIANAFYFTNTIYAIFMKHPALNSILRGIRLSISKFRLFMLPYCLILLLLYTIMKLGSLLKFRYSAILLGLMLLTYAAVARYYASALAFEAEKGLK